jgi:hypothetical protein
VGITLYFPICFDGFTRIFGEKVMWVFEFTTWSMFMRVWLLGCVYLITSTKFRKNLYPTVTTKITHLWAGVGEFLHFKGFVRPNRCRWDFFEEKHMQTYRQWYILVLLSSTTWVTAVKHESLSLFQSFNPNFWRYRENLQESL